MGHFDFDAETWIDNMRKMIFLADDDADIVDLLTHRCKAMGLRVDSASNATAALGKIEECIPDVVILDVDMPYGDGLCICEMMAKHIELRDIPVIILTGNNTEETVRRCHSLCAYYVPKCTELWSRVEPLLVELLDMESSSATEVPAPGAKPETTDLIDSVFAVLGVEEGDCLSQADVAESSDDTDGPWVLSIEDDDDVALALQIRLREQGLRLVRASAGREGYRKAFTEAPRAILLDYELPQGNGDYVLRRLKENPVTCEIPVIVLTGRREGYIERQMRSLGAAEFLNKPIEWNRLRSALNVQLETSP